jgi:hypothetical protein
VCCFGLATVKIGYGSLYFYCSFLVLIGTGVYYLLHGRFPLQGKVKGSIVIKEQKV